MPFKNYHACRLINHDRFTENGWVTVERTSASTGKKYKVVRGRLKSSGNMTDQAFRYPKNTWAESEARGHCNSHKGILFEAASDEGAGARHAFLYSQPWVMETIALNEILSHYEGIDCRVPGININDDIGVRRIGSAAVIPIIGVLDQRLNILQWVYGGVATEEIGAQIKAALADDEISQIILEIDSPGGSVNGVQSLGDLIFAGRGKKKITAFVSSTAFSGAAWIASAASEIILSSKTARVGSLGVVIAHREYSGLESKLGIKTTEITAGKLKRVAGAYEPLTEEGKKYLFDQAKAVHDAIISDLVRNLGFDENFIRENIADAQIFTGQQAIDAGLAIRFDTLDNLIMEAKTMPTNNVPTTEPQAAQTPALTVDSLKTENPEVYQAVFAAGVESERGRLMAIDKIAANAPAAAQEMIEKARKDGKEPQALAMEIMTSCSLQAQQQAQAQEPAPLVAPEPPAVTAQDLAQEAPKAVKSLETKEKEELEAAEEQELLTVMAVQTGGAVPE